MQEASWEEALFVDRAAADPDAPVSPFVAMQRVVIRMLFDPEFVAKVYENPGSTLAGLDLDAKLVEQLLENDRRLWNADRLRRARALKILLDEFKVTSTLVLAECGRVSFLDAFFSSEHFHDAVTRRGYMAVAFISYLERAIAKGELESPHTRAALALESEMARARRELRDARRGRDPALRDVDAGRPGERWVVAPGVRAALLPAGTIPLVQKIEKYLFELSQVPALALCEDVPRPEPLPELQDGVYEGFLFEPEPRGKVELSGIPATFVHVLRACSRPIARAELAERLAPENVPSDDVRELAEELVTAGVLRRVEVDGYGHVSLLPSTT